MAKRKSERTVTISGEQRRKLERLWFYYGNYGPQTTPGNRSFIQGYLEHGIDTRSLRSKQTTKSEIPTHECEADVESILDMKSDTGSGGQGADQSGLRVISSAPSYRRTDPDPEMKAILDNTRRRALGRHEMLEGDRDTPEAA